MKLEGKNILLISPESWDHIFVSKHHYAIHFGRKGNKVFFLNPPSVTEPIGSTGYENVFSVCYDGFPKGLQFYPTFIQKFVINKKIAELQKQCKATFDVIWSFDSSVFFDFSGLPKEMLKICHIVDLNQNFQLKQAASTADYCFCPSEILKRKLKVYNAMTFKISHGYSELGSTSPTPVNLPGKNRIKVFYAGNLDIPYIDWDLVQTLVLENSDVDFCFAGSKSDSNMKMLTLSHFDNFHYLGRLSGNELPSYLKAADIMLLAYRADEFTDQLANPHKAMEYLASGRVLVATYTDELRLLRDEKLICMSDKNIEFPSLFSTALKNLFNWNSTEKAEKRRQYALENKYEKQIERIELILK